MTHIDKEQLLDESYNRVTTKFIKMGSDLSKMTRDDLTVMLNRLDDPRLDRSGNREKAIENQRAKIIVALQELPLGQ